MNRIGKIGRGLFGVAMLSALGVGVTQAFAEPASAARRECRLVRCHWLCTQNGPGWYGECVDGACQCYLS